MDQSFTEAEKRFVLAEMIKGSQMDVARLAQFVETSGILDNFDMLRMQVPIGRNVSQSVFAVNAHFSRPVPIPTMLPMKRKSLGDPQEHSPKRMAMSPAEPSPWQPNNYFPLQPVSIQPRPTPPTASGYTSAVGAAPASLVSGSTTPTQPSGTGRKRGRPSKADKEQLRPSLPTTYAPISPAPTLLVPHTVAAKGHQTSYSSPSGSSAYTTTPQPQSSQMQETKTKRKGKAAAARKGSVAASIPRAMSVQDTASGDGAEEADGSRQGGMAANVTHRPVSVTDVLTDKHSPASNQATDRREGPEATQEVAAHAQGRNLQGIDRILDGPPQPTKAALE